MHGAVWITLFRQIPVAWHDGMTLQLGQGTEIVVQRIVRLERDFVLLRGRMAGNQDGGLTMFIPYASITNVLIAKRTEVEVEAAFAQGMPDLPMEMPAYMPMAMPGASAATAPVAVGRIETGPIAATPTPQPAAGDTLSDLDPTTNTVAPVSESDVARPKHPSKTVLLAKLRARLGAEVK